MTVPNYVTLTDVQNYMPTGEVATTHVWDTLVNTLCTNLSRSFDTFTNRAEGAYAVSADTTRYYDGVNPQATDFCESLFIAEIAATPTSISIADSGYHYTPIASSDYFMWPDNAANDGYPYWRVDLNPAGQTKQWPWGRRRVQIVGKFGYSLTPPGDVFEALLLMVVKFLRKAQQNYLDTGVILDSGQVMIGAKVDQDIMDLITYYRHESLGGYPT